ncbi:MAG TPA: sigma factor-like helix-turn-helix DNA-binding protein, partial [Dongiaceae bacterium]
SQSQEDRLGEDQELGRRQKLLERAMAVLNPRERRILLERRLKDEPATLEDLSKEFGISRERVRQIEVRAFEKIQRSIRNAAIDERLTAE